MILADGTRVNIKTDTIYREGDPPEADAAAKVGAGAVAGAILGAVIGGKKGAAIGTAAGAAGGAATVMRGDPGESSLPGGAPLTVRLTEDVAITINRYANSTS
jgi:outer membrane lipoprotein SlyB